MRRMFVLTAFIILTALSLSVSYNFTGLKWNYNPSYTVYQLLDTEICEGASSAVRRAADTWSKVPGQTFRLTYAGTSTKSAPSQDGKNTVLSSNLGASEDPGITYFWYTENELVECDMVLNSIYLWDANPSNHCYDGHYDVESVAAHEFGHWLQLDDVDDPEATMYRWIYFGETKKRTLSSDDENGIKAIYAQSTPPPCSGCCGGKGGGCDRIPVDPIDDPGLLGERRMPYSQEGIWLYPLPLVKAFEGVRLETLSIDPNWDILTLYWQNKCEILRLLWENTSLLEQAVELVTRYRAEIENLILGGDGGTLDAKEIDELTSWLAAFQEKASPNLKEAIMKVRQVLETCEGMTLREAISMDIDQQLIEGSKKASMPPSWRIRISPNPSRGTMNIRCDVPLQTDVCIEIYDLRGRSVGKVVSATLGAGCYTWNWERHVSPGVYFVRIQASGYVRTEKIVILSSSDR